MEVIQALIQIESTLSSIGPWIDDLKVLENDFVQLQYSHVRRECNAYCKGTIYSPSLRCMGSWPNEPSIINL